MELLHLLRVFTFLSVILVGISSPSSSLSSPEDYWNSVLPTTPIPKSIKDILYPGEKSTSVQVETGKPAHVNVKSGNLLLAFLSYGTTDDQIHDNVGHDGVGVETREDAHMNVKPANLHPFFRYDATDDQILQDDTNVALFFLEKDIRTGKKMNIQFTKPTKDATFLPRPIADSTPFSSDKLPEILNQFSVKPKSEEGKIIKEIIEECESPAINGEEKYCPTSLESMIDFTTSKLGTTRLNAFSTQVNYYNRDSEWKVDEYAITRVQQVCDKTAVVCHKLNYGYAVFYCHKTYKVRAYTVALKSTKLGVLVNAAVVCHNDTSVWNPKHLAFQVLKVKAGSVPICHFLLSENDILWVPDMKKISLLGDINQNTF